MSERGPSAVNAHGTEGAERAGDTQEGAAVAQRLVRLRREASAAIAHRFRREHKDRANDRRRMRSAAASVFLLVVAMPVVAGDEPMVVAALGQALYSGPSGTCTAAVSLVADSTTSSGVVEASGSCVVYDLRLFAFGQCQDLCTGECDVGATVLCWFGAAPPDSVIYAQLDPDGTFVLHDETGVHVEGLLTRAEG